MRIIPAIDIIDGKCVRLKQGDYLKKKIYSHNPLDIAKSYEDIGIKYLHVVDLDGAKAKTIINHKILEQLCTKTQLNIDFGGGIRSDESVRIAMESGVGQITCGSVAIKNPQLVTKWIESYGPDKIILGADVRNRKIAVHGWQDQTEIDIAALIDQYRPNGLKYCICTDISTDGMLQGPAIDLYKNLQSEYPDMCFVASGGVGNMDHIQQLKEIDMDGVIIGTAIYEGAITLKELIQYVD